MEASDIATLSSQASSALAALDSRLKELQAQQTALLASISITSDSLDTLPSLATITPTMNLIPTYTTKVSRLKKTMAAQTATMSQLLRRANDVKAARERNKKRMAEMVEREGERDRTVLQARYHGEGQQDQVDEAMVVGTREREEIQQQPLQEEDPSGSGMLAPSVASLQLSTSQIPSGASTPSGSGQPKLVIKRKKKPRQAEIE